MMISCEQERLIDMRISMHRRMALNARRDPLVLNVLTSNVVFSTLLMRQEKLGFVDLFDQAIWTQWFYKTLNTEDYRCRV